MIVTQRVFRCAVCTVVGLSLVVVARPADAHQARATSVWGPPPTNCPSTPPSHHLFTSGSGFTMDGVGGSPVWAGSPYLHAVVHSGGEMKVLWLLEPGTKDPVTLRGWNLRTGRAIRFVVPSLRINWATRAKLDPSKVTSFSAPDGWEDFPSDLVLSGAGCYVVFAQWKQASWLVPFAVGR
jgi:hypothetical protein